MSDGTPQPPQQPGQPTQQPGAFPPPQQPGAVPPQQPGGAPPPGATPPPASTPPPMGTPPPGYTPAPGSAPAPGAPPEAGWQPPNSGIQPPSMGAPPPGLAAEEPKKKRRIWVWLLILIGIPLLLVGGCVAFVLNVARGPLDATNGYIALLDEQRFDEAYDAAHPECQEIDRTNFVLALQDLDIVGYNMDSVSTTNNNVAVVSGTITLAPDPAVDVVGEDTRTAQFNLRTLDGDWKVCGFDIGEAGAIDVPVDE